MKRQYCGAKMKKESALFSACMPCNIWRVQVILTVSKQDRAEQGVAALSRVWQGVAGWGRVGRGGAGQGGAGHGLAWQGTSVYSMAGHISV